MLIARRVAAKETSSTVCKFARLPAANFQTRTMPEKKASQTEIRSSNRQTVETPTAPGSDSNFTGLPVDDNAIPVTTPVTGQQMQVLP